MVLDPSKPPRPLAQRLGPFPSERGRGRERLFSRIGVDLAIHDAMAHGLLQAHDECGLGIYAMPGVDAQKGCVALWVDEPLEPQRMRDAQRLEYQFLPSQGDRTRGGASRGDWKPTLPTDLADASRIADRVELARRTSHPASAVVGAAIAAADVERDVRFLIECGFDGVCLIADGCYGWHPSQRVALANAEETVAAALAVRESLATPRFEIRVAANVSPRQAAMFLRWGVDAVAIDPWIQDRAPMSQSRSESFGGFLLEVARPVAPQGSWLYESIREFAAELDSEQRFLDG